MLHLDVITPVARLLERHAGERPDQVAYRDAHRVVTRGRLATRTASIAGNLTGALLGDGDRVAIFLPSCASSSSNC